MNTHKFKYLFFALAFSLVSISSLLTSALAEAVERDRKTVFIILDGISADVLEKIETPNLDNIAGTSGYARAYVGGEAGGYSESPTVSAVGYNHLLTGTWSNKHNVYNNDIAEPNYNYWSLFRLLNQTHPEKKTAIYSSWLDNRTKLIGDGLAEAGSFSVDIHYDGFELDEEAFPHNDGYIQEIDEHVSNKAALSIRNKGPDLSWVYLWYPDDVGHSHGDGEMYYQSLRIADTQIGRIWDAVRYRVEEHNEEWLFIVTTDHGRRLPDGRDHGGQSERERTIWIITDAPDTNEYFATGEAGIVSIYPTITRFMGLETPPALERELDGVPLIGKVSLSSPTASLESDSGKLRLTWRNWQEDGEVRIGISPTNHFQNGGVDTYTFLSEVPLKNRETVVDISSMPSNHYKVVLAGPHNTVNTWVFVTRD